MALVEKRGVAALELLEGGAVSKQVLVFVAVTVVLAGIAISSWGLNGQKPDTVIDDAFDVFGLARLSDCEGFDEQRDVFLEVRGAMPALTEEEHSTLVEHWTAYLASNRGGAPDSCEWTIQPYPLGFIATGPGAMIVLNPSDAVVGASLPEGTTGDLVMDGTRYSANSLGAFRGAATIPPRSLAVIALR